MVVEFCTAEAELSPSELEDFKSDTCENDANQQV